MLLCRENYMLQSALIPSSSCNVPCGDGGDEDVFNDYWVEVHHGLFNMLNFFSYHTVGVPYVHNILYFWFEGANVAAPIWRPEWGWGAGSGKTPATLQPTPVTLWSCTGWWWWSPSPLSSEHLVSGCFDCTSPSHGQCPTCRLTQCYWRWVHWRCVIH